ncbi:MAG: hypothetical protein JXR52_09020 [Bacteroidales bacterium]|nr:hypothetical protein [Bacteroidales bacterium]MBN2698955.1 hypothetical protein [Bacteroidales bacterium]
MKYVDQILNYLSGKLQGTQARQFERELADNKTLQEEFDQVQWLYDRLDDIPSVRSGKREGIIKKSMIDADVERYGGIPETVDERAFMSKLNDSIAEARERKKRGPGRLRSLFLPLLYTAVAASLVVFVLRFFSQASTDQLFARYFQPSADPSLAFFRESTRGATEAGIGLFYEGQYRRSMETLKSCLENKEGDSLVRLFYALACMNSGCTEDLAPFLNPENTLTNSRLESSLNWYYALYLLKNGEPGNASLLLKNLTTTENVYHRKAKRLLRKID